MTLLSNSDVLTNINEFNHLHINRNTQNVHGIAFS